MKRNNPFAEVIESSYTGFIAQSWCWDQVPQFGSLVTVDQADYTLIAMVYQAHTGSLEAGRYPFAYQKSLHELLQEQPQIFEFLKTTFSALSIGYIHKERLYSLLAPEPPKIHSFVQSAERVVAERVIKSPDFLPLLFGCSGLTVSLDELLLAFLACYAAAQVLTRDCLQMFIKRYCVVSAHEYRRIRLFVQRSQQLVLINTL